MLPDEAHEHLVDAGIRLLDHRLRFAAEPHRHRDGTTNVAEIVVPDVGGAQHHLGSIAEFHRLEVAEAVLALSCCLRRDIQVRLAHQPRAVKCEPFRL